MESMTLIAAIRKHLFSKDEKLGDISAQYKQLTDKDKADLKAEFAKIGIEIVEKA
jgi:hypothetical protein